MKYKCTSCAWIGSKPVKVSSYSANGISGCALRCPKCGEKAKRDEPPLD